MQSIMQMKANGILDCLSNNLAACQWKWLFPSVQHLRHRICTVSIKNDIENWAKSSIGPRLRTI